MLWTTLSVARCCVSDLLHHHWACPTANVSRSRFCSTTCSHIRPIPAPGQPSAVPAQFSSWSSTSSRSSSFPSERWWLWATAVPSQLRPRLSGSETTLILSSFVWTRSPSATNWVAQSSSIRHRIAARRWSPETGRKDNKDLRRQHCPRYQGSNVEGVAKCKVLSTVLALTVGMWPLARTQTR